MWPTLWPAQISRIFGELSPNRIIQFAGREFDEETGPRYCRPRFLDAGTGRFLQQDPHPGTIMNPITMINKYAYAGNNPLIYLDPSGKDFWSGLLQVVEIVAVAVLAFYTGGLAAGLLDGALGFTAGTASAAIVGTLAGIGAGGVVGALAFPALGLGTSQQGFMFGGLAGGLGGLSEGMGWIGNYTVKPWNGDGSTLSHGIQDAVNNGIKGLATPGSASPTFTLPSGTQFMSFLARIEPYAIGIGGPIAVDAAAYNCASGNCNIPVQTQNWSF